MKKLVGIFILMILTSGCEATYELEISDTNFNEKLDVYADKSDLSVNLEDFGDMTLKEMFDLQNDGFSTAYFNDPNYNPYDEEKQSDVKYYNQNLINESNRYGIRYDYKFNIGEAYRSRAVNTCYKDFTINKSNNIYSLSTNNVAKCFANYSLLDKVTINVNVQNRVILSNADKVNGNIYTWIITKDNYNNKSIKLSYTTSNRDIEYTEEDRKKDEENNKPNNDPIDNPNNKDDDNNNSEKKSNLFDYILVIAVVGLFVIGIVGFIIFKGTKSE